MTQVFVNDTLVALVEALLCICSHVTPARGVLHCYELVGTTVLHGPPPPHPCARPAFVPEVAHLHLDTQDDELLPASLQVTSRVYPANSENWKAVSTGRDKSARKGWLAYIQRQTPRPSCGHSQMPPSDAVEPCARTMGE